jgi:hypothetical protein
MFSPKPFLKPSTCLCQMGILCEPGVCSVPGSAPQTPHDFAGYQPTSYTRSHENQEIRKSVIMQVKHRDTSQHPNHLPANILHNACVIEVCNSLALSTEDGAHEQASGSPVTLLALNCRHRTSQPNERPGHRVLFSEVLSSQLSCFIRRQSRQTRHHLQGGKAVALRVPGRGAAEGQVV